MGEKRRQYTREYKLDAVRLLDDSGRTKAQVARELGIHDSLLTRWKAQLEGLPGGRSRFLFRHGCARIMFPGIAGPENRCATHPRSGLTLRPRIARGVEISLDCGRVPRKLVATRPRTYVCRFLSRPSSES